jgi:hypothetical protein
MPLLLETFERHSMIARRIVAAGFVISLGTVTATAQAAGDSLLQIGDRIRITTARSSLAIKGTLVAADDTALTVAREGRDTTERKFARSEIATLEVARGKKSHWVAGSLVGLLGGVALTAAYCVHPSPFGGECSSGDYVAVGALFGGIGAASGALVGLLIRTDRWTAVPADRLNVSVSPVPGHGLSLTLRLSF